MFADGRPLRDFAHARLAFDDDVWERVREACLTFLRHEDPNVQGVAATCLGHLARIHGTTDRSRIVPALERLKVLGSRAVDALGDIDTFAPESTRP